MTKDEYQKKFVQVKPWLVEVIRVVKKDLRKEHLKIDRDFCKRYFLGKNLLQIQPEEMAPAYEKEIEAGNVGLGEFIASRWLLNSTDVYDHFEKQLSAIDPDFEKLESLDASQSQAIVDGSVKQFGARNTYVFSIFNSVVFPDEVLENLRKLALAETDELMEQQTEQEGAASLEKLQKRHEREVSAMRDRYEKKLSGLQKKYVRDVEMLKKQIGQLQKKLNAHE